MLHPREKRDGNTFAIHVQCKGPGGSEMLGDINFTMRATRRSTLPTRTRPTKLFSTSARTDQASGNLRRLVLPTHRCHACIIAPGLIIWDDIGMTYEGMLAETIAFPAMTATSVKAYYARPLGRGRGPAWF